MTDEHDERVRQQFRAQAATFTDEGFAARGLDWIIAELPLSSTDVVLDVAAGAMHLAHAVAPYAAHVCAIDLTPEMLIQGGSLAEAAGIRNVTAQVGNATSLPWLDGQFDLVMCRLALHQVADPAAVLNEMFRVTRRGGTIAVIDIVVDSDEAVASEANRLERLRDPSHNRTLTESDIVRLVESTGAVPTRWATTPQPLDLEDWLDRTDTPPSARQEIADRLATEVAGGPITGLQPRYDDHGVWSFVHDWFLLTATKTDPGQP